MPIKKRPLENSSNLTLEQNEPKKAKRRVKLQQKKNEDKDLVNVQVHDSAMIASTSNSKAQTNNNSEHSSSFADYYPINDDQMIDGMLYDISLGQASGSLMPNLKVREQNIPSQPYRLPEVDPCSFCLAKRFPTETPTFCCSKGKISLYETTMPGELKDLYLQNTAESTQFLQFIRPYNTTFAFTSLKVNLDPEYAKRVSGIYTFRAQGQMYHCLLPLYTANVDSVPAFLQVYFYDTQDEVQFRKHGRSQLESATIEKLIVILKDNPYSKFFRSLRLLPDINTYEIKLKANPRISARNNAAPSVSQVAAIWNENEDQTGRTDREITVQKHNKEAASIKYYYGCYDPLQYPLLFPLGEPGWHVGIQKQRPQQSNQLILGANSATAEQLIENEEIVAEENTEGKNMVSVREFYAYRFQMRPSDGPVFLQCGRLLQQFAVDMYIKVESSRLDFFRYKQAEIIADLYQGIVDSINAGETQGSHIGKRIVLPATFIGGPRNMRKRYMDAMALVQKYGKPDLFLTMTCNPTWIEITSELGRDEEAQNRPDLIARVFNSKFNELKKEVLKDHLFGKVEAYTYVIENQKRGLPHAHLVIILKKGYKLNTPKDFDAFISAELPNPETQAYLYKAVTKHMMHGPCGALNSNNACMENGICKDHYPRAYCERTTIAEDGYPTYKREDNNRKVKIRGQKLDNAWVVPYNSYLVAKFDCHINVKVCSTIKAIKYLYKYIYKGHDRVTYCLVLSNDNGDIDEIQEYQAARWVSPPEAIWRIYAFSMHEMSPSVITLQIHLEGEQRVTFKPATQLSSITNSDFYYKTMLTEFFWMNKYDNNGEAKKELYQDYVTTHVWNGQKRFWKHRQKQQVIGRMIIVNPSEGERYYLRMLLGYVPGPTSYQNLKTVDDYIATTYQEAAILHGLLEHDKSNEDCLDQACIYQTPYSLRELLCNIFVHCKPKDPRQLFLKFQHLLQEDYIYLQKVSETQAQQLLLQAMASHLESVGKSLKHFNLNDLVTSGTEKNSASRAIHDELAFPTSDKDRASIQILNEEQLDAFKVITDAVSKKRHQAFFIDGPGGTGKTFLYRAILAHVRGEGKISLATASSGIAASILPNGRTAHSRFKIPIDKEGKIICGVTRQSGNGAVLKASALIIWDEASMAKRQSIEALDHLLQDLTQTKFPFGGKVIVFGGDFRQTLPVIPKATKEECMNASVIRSYIWASLTKMKLKVNMRAKLDPIFSDYILRIGNGVEETYSKNQIKIPQHLLLQQSTMLPAIEEFISFVYPSLHMLSPDAAALTESAILTPKNETVDQINDMIINKFPGAPTIYHSFDQTNDIDQQGMYIDLLNSICPTGMAAHRLVLKKNCPVLLLRNLNPSKGLCNGTRLICKEFQKNLIVAEFAIGERKGDKVFLPRIIFESNHPEHYPVEFSRKQFPIRLCFAMTINKAQGQTLNRVGIYLPEEVFSHGQLYIAMSRATTSTNVRLLLEHRKHDLRFSSYTANIVYTELLAEAYIST